MSGDGSPLAELEAVAGAAAWFQCNAEFDVPDDRMLMVHIAGDVDGPGWSGTVQLGRAGSRHTRTLEIGSVGAGFRAVGERFPRATLRVGSVRARVPRAAKLPAGHLTRLAERAWYEARGIPVPDADDLDRLRDRARTERRAAMALLPDQLRVGPEAVAEFNRRPAELRRQVDFRKANLSGAALDGIDLGGVDLRAANLEGASLVGASFTWNGRHTPLGRARFAGADLRRAAFGGSRGDEVDFAGADLRDADFTNSSWPRGKFAGANLGGARLQGANLRDADLAGARLDGAVFDQATAWPDGFDPPAGLVWDSGRPDPRGVR